MDSPMFQPPPQPSNIISREEAVAVARSWVGTPYVLGGRIRGAGCDCATLLAEYAVGCGFAPRENIALYSHDWFANTSEERYKFAMMRYAKPTIEAVCRGTVEAKPGCIALFKVVRARVYNHGAIITKWPMMIHAVTPEVAETNAVTNYMTSHREIVIFDPWESTL
jgi:cell wall-associated NlpC family hydrolase